MRPAHEPIRGLVAATFTPMKDDASLDLARIPAITEHLLTQSLGGVFLCGSTGEGPSLSTTERMEVTEAYVEAFQRRLPIIVQVGHNSTRESKALADHAHQCGVDAIAMTPPSYFPIRDSERIIDCLEDVATQVPQTPLYYYHIPSLTSVSIDVPRFVERARTRLPSFAGVKYSAPSLDQLRRCLEEHGKDLTFLFGCDEMLLEGLIAGAHGAVGSTYNFFGVANAALVRAVDAFDLAKARKIQALTTRLIRGILQHDPLAALKATMSIAGVDCGPPRLPARPLDPVAMDQLKSELDKRGLQTLADIEAP